MFLAEHRPALERNGQKHKVSPEIHHEDFIFHFLHESPVFDTKEKAIDYYFDDGANSAKKLSEILTTICGFDGNQIRLLEFASGYGCVTRHIRMTLPWCLITACDIHPQAVQFIREILETEAVLSTSHPEDLHLDQKYDVVFALSFFSHMPKTTFGRWLTKLASFVKPEGYLIFTTHGLVTRKAHSPDLQFDADGFYFIRGSEQKDLSGDEYGVTITRPQFVLDRIFEVPNLTLKYFQEGFWWKHQDLFVVKVVEEQINVSAKMTRSESSKRIIISKAKKVARMLWLRLRHFAFRSAF